MVRNQQTLVYLDDSLGSGPYRVEVVTLQYLEASLKDQGVTVLGFSTLEGALTYFDDPSHDCTLFVCDHNLWWGKEDNGSYRYRFGCDFMKHLYERRPDLKEVEVIVYTDSPDYAYSEWSWAQALFNSIVPKYSENDVRKPWQVLLEGAIRILLSCEGKEGGKALNL